MKTEMKKILLAILIFILGSFGSMVFAFDGRGQIEEQKTFILECVKHGTVKSLSSTLSDEEEHSEYGMVVSNCESAAKKLYCKRVFVDVGPYDDFAYDCKK